MQPFPATGVFCAVSQDGFTRLEQPELWADDVGGFFSGRL